jgi:sugar phosphate isomerase/epimerase
VAQERRSPRRPRGFRLGVCDWTIGKRTDPAALELAKNIGCDGVQVDFGSGDEDLPLFDAELQQRYLKLAREQRMRIASLAMGTLNNVAYKSDPRAERWVDRAIDVAQAMRQRIILLAFFGKGDLKNDTEGTNAVVSRLKNVASKAEKARVTLGIESWLSAREHLDIIERVGSPAVKVYYDVGNSHKMGYDIYQEIRTLAKQICQFHAKDYNDLYGKGSVDFPRVRDAMDDVGYRGWLVMEGTKMPLGVEESCRYDAEYLRKVFPRNVL